MSYSPLDPEEKDQLEKLHNFWQRNGRTILYILFTASLTVVLVLAINFWEKRQIAQSVAGFDAFEKALENKNMAEAERSFASLKDKAPRMAWTARAALILAQQWMAQNNPKAAQKALVFAAEHAKDEGYAGIARLRLSALLMDEGQYGKALDYLNEHYPRAFRGLVADRKGDIYTYQRDYLKAASAYKEALENINATEAYWQLVQAKLLSLPVMAGPPITTY